MRLRIDASDLQQYHARLCQVRDTGIPSLEHHLSVAAGGVENSESPAGRRAGGKARHFSNRSIEEFKLRTERAIAIADLVIALSTAVRQGDRSVREAIEGPGPQLPTY